MPAVVEKRGDKWVVLSHQGGSVKGTHSTLEKARRQQRAINRSLKMAGKI